MQIIPLYYFLIVKGEKIFKNKKNCRYKWNANNLRCCQKKKLKVYLMLIIINLHFHAIPAWTRVKKLTKK